MKLKDNDLWEHFAKTVSKIDNSNIVINVKNVRHNVQVKKMDLDARLFRGSVGDVALLGKRDVNKFVEECRLDLHGVKRDFVEESLISFCLDCMTRNIRSVVIVTGKGSGVVREETKTWLSRANQYVVAFSPIKDSFGEIGAYIVQLRKLRKKS